MQVDKSADEMVSDFLLILISHCLPDGEQDENNGMKMQCDIDVADNCNFASGEQNAIQRS